MEYNLKITTDDSELQDTQDLLVEIGDTASEIQGEINDAFSTDAVETFREGVEDTEDALRDASNAAKKTAEEQEKLNKATNTGTKSNKRLGSSLVTNALRMAGFSKEARIAGAALNILNKISLSNLGKGLKGLVGGFKNLAVGGSNAFKGLVLSARTASLGIRAAIAATGIGLLLLLITTAITDFDKLKKVGVSVFKGILVTLNPVLFLFDKLTGATEGLGEKFTNIFNRVKGTIDSVVASTRDLLSSITGGLIDSAERAAERAAQIAREANREVLKSEKDRSKQVTSLIESETQLALKSAKERGAAQSELDNIAIEGNKKKAEALDIELKKQKEIIDALNLEILKQAEAANKDEDALKAREKAQNELIKASSEFNKIQSQIAQTTIDNANITQAAADRESEAIEKANQKRLETKRLEDDRKKRLEELNDLLLRSTREVLERQAREEKEARDREIDEVAKTDAEKIRLKEANQELLNNKLLEIDQSFEQKRIDLERSITGNTLKAKILDIEDNQKEIEDRIRESYVEQGKITERGEELIKQSRINAKNEIQAELVKFSEKEKKAEKDRIDQALKTSTTQVELEKQLQLNKLNASKEANETREEFERRAAKEREKIAIDSEIAILEATLRINTQLTDDERELIQSKIEGLKLASQQAVQDIGEAVDNAPNPFDFEGKLVDALEGLGLKDGDAEIAIQAAKDVASQIIDIYVAAADARLQAAEELVEFRNSNIEELNEQLDREIEKNKLGLASNIEKVETEIAREKQLRDEALVEQEKAARKKQQIETAVQSANLLSAIAQLYASLASSGPPGIIAATVISAAMIAAFVASRAQVANATQPIQRREGGLVDGPSHEQGGVKYYSRDNSRVIELEGNEFVTPVKQTKKHLKFLEAMRKGAFDNIDLMKAINNPSHIDSMNNSVIYYQIAQSKFNNDSVVSAIDRAARINTRGLQDLQDRPTVYEDGEFIVRETWKNGNRKVLKTKKSK